MAQKVQRKRLIFIGSSAQLGCGTPDYAGGWHVKDDLLFRESELNGPYGGKKVRVGGNKYEAIAIVVKGIYDHLYADGHIRLFFFRAFEELPSRKCARPDPAFHILELKPA